MIVFITTAAYSHTVRALTNGRLGQPLPPIQAMSYEKLFRARRVPAATYVFTDLDRLAPEGRELAADLHYGLGEAGLTRLNDPAKVLLRYDLLKALHRAGINPFDAYRADEEPRPKRFPVILRREDAHSEPKPPLIETQEALDAAIAAACDRGDPLRSMIVIEFCAEPIAPGLWERFGTMRVGNAIHATYPVIETSWYVKYGTLEFVPEAMHRDSLDVLQTNRFTDDIRPAFELAHIEYGRADHATVEGRQVIYEINTNPLIRPTRRQSAMKRPAKGRPAPALVKQGVEFARKKIAEMLWQIDSDDGRPVRFPRSDGLEAHRRRNSRLGRLFSRFGY